MLVAENLACRRGENLVFAGISFAVAPGEALLLTGANGAGKSTLLRLLAGLLHPEEGTLRRPPDARYLGHEDALKPSLTVAENLAFHAGLIGAPAGAVSQALAALGLAPLAHLPGRTLSAGQRRRLALARLALEAPGKARLWLLDEPTTGLDAGAVERLHPLLAGHLAAGGIIVAATHIALPLDAAREMRL